MEGEAQKLSIHKHFVLVHGACHGGWCWYKLKPLLVSAGHRVTALDLAASGMDRRVIHDLSSMTDYTAPLMELLELLPPGEKVVLVGHSFGGLNLALAMDRFPEKIAVAVFLTAFLPDTCQPPSYVLEQNGNAPKEYWLDTEFSTCLNSKGGPLETILFGPEFLRSTLYQHCSDEDYTLGTMLRRPASLFIEDLSNMKNFSEEGFGSVEKVYVVCGEDKIITREFQQRMIKSSGGVREVVEMNDADHMPMLCKPQQLCKLLLQIASEFP